MAIRGSAPLLAIASVWSTACGAAHPCTHTAECSPVEVCQEDGRCGAQDAERDRFTRFERIDSVDWASTGAEESGQIARDSDELTLGGETGAEVFLSFGVLPSERTIARAVLVVVPHSSYPGAEEQTHIVVHRTLPFRGSQLTSRNTPMALGAPIASRALDPASIRPLRFDITDTVQRVASGRNQPLDLRLHVVSAEKRAVRLGSPRALDHKARPRLELRLY